MRAQWSLKIKIPAGVLAVYCDDHDIIEADYIFHSNSELAPQNALAEEAARQIRAYTRNPKGFVFALPLSPAPNEYQRRVRKIILSIPIGSTLSYGDIAMRIDSAPRAVGGACRANKLSLLVPCHRVIATGGSIGGFKGMLGQDQLRAKRALLNHEGARYHESA